MPRLLPPTIRAWRKRRAEPQRSGQAWWACPLPLQARGGWACGISLLSYIAVAGFFGFWLVHRQRGKIEAQYARYADLDRQVALESPDETTDQANRPADVGPAGTRIPGRTYAPCVDQRSVSQASGAMAESSCVRWEMKHTR